MFSSLRAKRSNLVPSWPLGGARLPRRLRRLAMTLDVKRLAAAAAALLVRIAEDKAGFELFLHVIHLGAEDEHDRLGIDQHGDALVLDDLVEFALLVGVFEGVAEARAATRAYADAHADRGLAALREQRLDALRRRVGPLEGLGSRQRHYRLTLFAPSSRQWAFC